MDRCLLTPPTDDTAPASSWAARASRALHPSRTSLSDDWLWAVTSGLASSVVPWELRDDADPAHGGELVLATDRYEAWVLSWPPGTEGEWHEHEGVGAFCVVSGTLDEVGLSASGTPATRRHGPSTGAVFAPGDGHRVANRHVRTATSLHVYTR